MKGCNVFLVCFILFVLSVCGKGQSTAQNACRTIHEIPCDDGRQCINRKHWCDGNYDCTDKSDEEFCTKPSWYQSSKCTQKHFECEERNCIPLAARCDTFNDCDDMSDEEDCEQITTTERTSHSIVTETTARSEYPTPSEATRISTSTSSIITPITEYYDKRRSESNVEDRNTYYPPHYYEQANGNNENTHRQNRNSYSRQDHIPRNNYRPDHTYPHPQNPERNSDRYGIPQPRNPDTPYRRDIGLRQEYDPHRRYQNSHVDRQPHLALPPRTVRYPPTSRPSYSSNIREKRPDLIPFHFEKNYTEQFKYDYEVPIKRAKEWILNQRDGSYSWGKDTPRALIALSLITNSFTSNITENEFMKKNFQTHLGIKILRNRTSTEKISPTRLAMYINALLATCQDPRNFFDMDLVKILEGRKNYLEKDQAFVNPLVFLTLCLTNKADFYNDPQYLKYLLQTTFSNEVLKDLHILTTTALACYLQQDVNNQDLRSTLDKAAHDLMREKKSDGSFGNKYNTALAVQALMSLNLSVSWSPESMLDYIAQKQLPDGSFGDMMATYYSVLALSGRSLLHLRNTQCDPADTTIESTPKDTLGPKKRIFYTLRIGYPETNSMSMQLSLPLDASFFDAMVIAEKEDPRYKFNYKITNDKLGVYSISNIQNDAERGRFWNLYHLKNTNATIDRNRRYPGDIRELIPGDSDEMLYWYLPMF